MRGSYQQCVPHCVRDNLQLTTRITKHTVTPQLFMSKAFIPFLRATGRGEKLKRDLTYEESVECMRMMLSRTASDAQIGALLLTQRVKGEAVDEIKGFTDVIRDEFLVRIRPNIENLLDIACPYNGKSKTAQLAPAVAFTLLTAGVPVILHGGENIPTKSGVTPGAVLRGLGLPTHLTPSATQAMLEQVGFGFLDITQFAPAWVEFNEIRHQFGLRTVCNTIEKLFNPADAPYQISGFFHGNYIERIRSTQTGTRASWMIQGEEGSIETASGRRTHIYATQAERDLVLAPADVGLIERERIQVPAEVDQHVDINLAVMQGETGPAQDQVALTAGTIFTLLGVESNVPAGFEKAKQLLHDQKVAATLSKLLDQIKTSVSV